MMYTSKLMQLFQYKRPSPEAFRGFIEGLQKLQDYLRTNAGERLEAAEEQFDESLAVDPDFAPAQYYKAIVLTHARRADQAIELLEDLNQKETPFKAEVLYNLAFACAKTYRHKEVERSLDLIKKAKDLATQQQRVDLEILVQAMEAWLMAVFGGLELGNPADFVYRQKKYLRASVSLAESVLAEPELKSLASETSNAVKVEANNAAGIALMYMGKYSLRFDEETDYYWKLADASYRDALQLHSRDVRVLDNVATLELMRASRAARRGQIEEMSEHSRRAKDLTLKALSYNRHDQFRFRTLARACALLGEMEEALGAAEQMRYEPGVFDDAAIAGLEIAIATGKLSSILEITEEKSAP